MLLPSYQGTDSAGDKSWKVCSCRLYPNKHLATVFAVELAPLRCAVQFGKRLSAEAERQWRDWYIDYKACKRAIQADVESGGAVPTLPTAVHASAVSRM